MSNGALTAKAKAVSGLLLNKEDYLSLTHKSSIAAAIAYLKQKPRYAKVFSDTDEATVRRTQAEALIHKALFDDYLRICKFSSGGRNSIMSFFIKQLEASSLSRAVIAFFSGSQESFVVSFPEYISKYLCFDPILLAEAKTKTAFLSAISKTPYYKPLEPLFSEEDPDINVIVTTINCCYIKWAFKKIDETTKGGRRQHLKSFFLRKADADNLLTCYRLAGSFTTDIGRISELLIPYHYRLRIPEIEDALKASEPVAALRALFVKKRLAAEELLYPDGIPEIAVNAADHAYFKHRLALSSDEAEALYSLVVLFETECINLCRVIEGLRYSLAPEETEKYLIMDR